MELHNAPDFKDPLFEQFLQKSSFNQNKQQGPLAKLKQTVLLHFILGFVLTLGYAGMGFLIPIWQVQACLAVVILFACWCLPATFKLYRNIQPDVSANNSVLNELSRHYMAIKKWMQINEQAGLLIYPFATAAGFILGGTAGSGKNVTDFICKPFFIIALVTAIIILQPLSWLITRWLFKISFGKQMQRLKENIAALQDDNLL
jgi:hypothetical protein